MTCLIFNVSSEFYPDSFRRQAKTWEIIFLSFEVFIISKLRWYSHLHSKDTKFLGKFHICAHQIHGFWISVFVTCHGFLKLYYPIRLKPPRLRFHLRVGRASWRFPWNIFKYDEAVQVPKEKFVFQSNFLPTFRILFVLSRTLYLDRYWYVRICDLIIQHKTLHGYIQQ